MKFYALLSSNIEFGDSEEYLAFRFRLLNVALLSVIVLCPLFVLLDVFGLNRIGVEHRYLNMAYCLVAVALFFLLRGRKHLYRLVAVIFSFASFIVFCSALLFVTGNEFRIIWFYVTVVMAYVLLGEKVGILISIASIAAISIGNRLLEVPFSGNAMTTIMISLTATSLLAYVYTSKSMSCFERMERVNRQLAEMANQDALTGVLNARAYGEVTKQLSLLAQRNNKPFSVLFLDLDHFKSVNDRHGHHVGDMVLQEVALCLSKVVRRSDVLGRVGGEEFAVFLPETNIKGAMLVAEALRYEIEALQLMANETESLSVTVSVGAAESLSSAETVEEIQRRADVAMYQAKDAGRNRSFSINDMQHEETAQVYA